jgi:predicted RNase H-like HicB family nuclease
VDSTSYHAEILEFPGCFAQGDTPADAYANLEKAAESWIDTCLSQGQQIPEPSSNVTYSGNIALRLPRSIHRQAARFADRDGTSLNTYLVSSVAARVGAEDFYNVLAQRLAQQLFQVAYFAYTYANFTDTQQTEAKRMILPDLLRRFQSVANSNNPISMLTYTGR